MAQRMRRDGLANARRPLRLLADLANGMPRNGLPWNVTGEEPVRWACGFPVQTQDVQQSRGEHDVSIFVPLALINSQHHSFTVDVGDFEVRGCRDEQSCSIRGRQQCTVLMIAD